MSSVPASFPFGTPTEPTFELALRGYEKRQVDRYVQQVEAEVAALTAEREELYAQINVLNQHVQQMQQEVANARRLMTIPGEGLTYRHLGARAEQILALAEEQAAEIRDRVTRELAEKEAALARTRAELDTRANDAANNFEQVLASRRAEEEQAASKRREALAAEVETAKAYAARVRSDVDALYTAALQESTRVGDATKAYADKVRDETEAHAAQVRAQVEEEAAQQRVVLATELATLRSATETELGTLRANATAEVNIQRAEAEAVVAARLAEVESLAAERAAVLDAELTRRRVDSEQEHAERRTTVERELAGIEAVASAAVRELRADAEAYASGLRSQADDHLATARTGASDAEQRRTMTLAEAEAMLATARTEAETLVGKARREAEEIVTITAVAMAEPPSTEPPAPDNAPITGYESHTHESHDHDHHDHDHFDHESVAVEYFAPAQHSEATTEPERHEPPAGETGSEYSIITEATQASTDPVAGVESATVDETSTSARFNAEPDATGGTDHGFPVTSTEATAVETMTAEEGADVTAPYPADAESIDADSLARVPAQSLTGDASASPEPTADSPNGAEADATRIAAGVSQS